MGGTEWTVEEDSLVVFFASLGVFVRVIADLLTQRGYNRSVPAIQSRTRALKNTYGLGEGRRWYLDATEDWLSRHLRASRVALFKVQPTEADQRCIQQAQASIDLQSAYNRLSQRITQDLQREWMETQRHQGGGGYYN